MNKMYGIGLLFALSLVSFIPRAHAIEPSRIVISEVAWAGSARNASDEWLELGNIGSEPVDVGGWQLIGAGTSASTLTLPEGVTLNPWMTYLIANYKNGDSSTLAVEPDFVTTALSLPNTGINILLTNINGDVIDELVDSGTPNAGSTTTFSSMERVLSDLSWATAETSQNLLNEQFGSPGALGHIAVESLVTVDIIDEAENLDEPSAIDETTSVDETIETSLDSENTPTEEVINEPVTESAPEDLPIYETITESESAIEQTTSFTITGFLSSPSNGGDEWVTVTNKGTEAVDLAGYALTDATGKKTILSGVIGPNETITITNPLGKLNNDGDTINLLDSTEATIDSISYGTDEFPAPKSDISMLLIDGIWTAVEPVEMVEVVEDVASESIAEKLAETVTNNETPVVDDTPSLPTEEISTTTTETSAVIDDAQPNESNIKALTEEESAPEVIAVAEEPTNTDSNFGTALTPGSIIISSAYPSPNTGDDEWIALTNTTNATVDLSSLSLLDASGATTSLSGTIGANGTVYVLNPKGNLNNDGDIITLVDANNLVLDSVAYGTGAVPAPKKGIVVSFAHENTHTELIQEPTTYENTGIELADSTSTNTTSSNLATSQGNTQETRETSVATTSTNVPATHSTRTSVKKTTSTKKSSSKSVASPKQITIDDIDRLADETFVTCEGIVVAQPGTIGKRSFFLDGLEVYQSQGDLALVTIGDHVRIEGTVSILSDHRRINIKAGAVTILGQSQPITHDFTPSLRYGSLARATGIVSARDGNAIVLRMNDDNTIAVTPGTGVLVNWTDFAGKTVTITGIYKPTSSQSTLVLRSVDDILVTESSADLAPIVSATTAPNIPWAPIGAATMAFLGLGAWFWYTKPRNSRTALTLKPSTV